MKVAIVYGGYSSEKDASTENAKYIREALHRKGYDTCMVPYEKDLIRTLRTLETDIVYVCVQGKGHGDGTIQAILEHEGIPFTGSGSHAAALINDKIVSKMFFERMGISTPKWHILTKEDYTKGLFDGRAFGYPFVAKAPSEGGSFGIALIRNENELDKIEDVFTYETTILIEKFVSGDFYTIGILGHEEKQELLPCVQGIELLEEKEHDDPDHLKVFTGDYTAKPARLSGPLLDEMTQMSTTIFCGIGAEDVARIDFMVSREDKKPYVLEINAVPGLKPKSLLPRAAEIAGIAYDDLIEGILLEAWKRWEQRRSKSC